ncbi:uncharacterized protein LOC132193215 [Neocloeon triangulifer]|uniref:uncharacterized protein LOC132193215 n=1 Tax=Neocloeon triangulifer TaxID=2078957 RepID=UPI00286F2617|nr:uncharacterized protein LOC132193215 [Neocloeon triangulifer]
MAAYTKFFLILAIFFGCICQLESKNMNIAQDVEVLAKVVSSTEGTTPSRGRRRFTSSSPQPGSKEGRKDNQSEDFTMTGSPSLDSTIFSTIGSLASTLFKSIFRSDSDKSGRDGGSGGGFVASVSRIFCTIFGGLFGSICGTSSSGPGGVDYDTPVNLTSQQYQQLQDQVKLNGIGTN